MNTMQVEIGKSGRVRERRSQCGNRKSKAMSEKEEEQKFNETLDRCREFLSNAMINGEDFFELLDPLISDTQCHMHSILILNVLHKCYNRNESTYQCSNELEEKDKKILSYAVLFSLLKTQCRDNFGLNLYEVSITDFNSSILSSRKKEKYHIINAKRNFNSYSVDYIKSIASDELREIFNQCDAIILNQLFKVLPCYASYITVMNHIEEKRWPIIVSLVNINRRIVDGGTEYSMNSTDVRFHEFREEGNRFYYKKYPSEAERKLPTIVFDCYSIINNVVREFPTDYDIKDFVMLWGASHIQLPKNSELPSPGFEDEEEFVRNLYKNNSDVYMKYEKDYERGAKENLISATYSRRVPSSVEHAVTGAKNAAFTVERRKDDVFCMLDHVHLANYSRECQRMKSLNLNAKGGQKEAVDLNKKTVTMEALRRFVIGQENL